LASDFFPSMDSYCPFLVLLKNSQHLREVGLVARQKHL
jgi:hypothetical protein